MEGKNPTQAVFTWVAGLGAIALFGLVMLILFGNLQGNTGFGNEQVTLTVTNEVGWANLTTYSLSVINSSTSGYTITAAWNHSDGTVLNSTQYSVSTLGIVTNGTNTQYDDVNFTYTYIYTYPSTELQNTDSVITNYTTSITNTSAQFPVVGTIIGIAILLAILIGVAVYALKKFNEMGGKSSSVNFG